MSHALARTTDIQTSHDAARKSDVFRASHEGKIYGVLSDADAFVCGMTYREIADATHMEPVAVARRLAHMSDRRLITRVEVGRHPITRKPMYAERGGCAIWWVA